MKQKLQGFVGQAYNQKARQINNQRMVNLYPELDESGAPKDAAIAYLKGTPGFDELMDLGDGPIRCVHVDGLQNDDGSYLQLNRVFIVSGSKVYRCLYESGAWSSSYLGDIGTSTGPVSAASIAVSYGATIFVDGSLTNYVYQKTDPSTETFQTFTDAGFIGVERATQVCWLDGFIVWIVQDSARFYVSQWNTLSVDPLDFASAEGDPDNIVAVIANHRDLWLLNERSVEIWANTGNQDFPFERVGGGFIENGCFAPWSVQKAQGYVFWLGRDKNGAGTVYMAQGLGHQRISTAAIEEQIADYVAPEDCTSYIYQDNGHIFYCLNFAEATWCYDVMTKAWHERGEWDQSVGEFKRHRGEFLTYFQNYGGHIFGDYENGKIYALNPETYTDNGTIIRRLRSGPHIANNRDNVQFKRLEIDMQMGVGLDGALTSVGAIPKVMMRFSKDGGYNWSNERQASFGQLGEFSKRVNFWSLGIARDMVFEISIAEPVAVTILEALIDVEQVNR